MTNLKTAIEPFLNEAYMSPSQVAVFKKHLIDMRTTLMAEQDVGLLAMRQGSERMTDHGDMAEQIKEQQENQMMMDRRRNKLRGIQVSLQAIEDEEFGYCMKCGIEIGLDRLLINPLAIHDSNCAELHEAEMKRLHARRVA